MKKMVVVILLTALILSTVITVNPSNTAFAATAATVNVDAANDLGTLNNPSWYVNQADYAPDLGQEDERKVQVLGLKYARGWLKPAKYYDESNGTYTYNYALESENGNTAYSFFDQLSKYTDRIILNVDQCDQVYMTVSDTSTCKTILKNGIKHYKQRYPEIEHIEAFNEPDKTWTPGHDESPAIALNDYYEWYKVFYTIINEVNAELNPAIPLKIGGPITYYFNSTYIQGFLDKYKDDTSTNKKMDFIAYHQYAKRSDPAVVESEKSTISGWLSDRGLSSRKVFVTEYGVFPGGNSGTTFEEDLLTQAAAMATLGYYYIKGGLDMAIHWVFDHPSNDRKSMFVDAADGAPYPYYNLVKMQSMLKTTRIGTTSNTLSSTGIGVNALGTKDSTGIAVLATNYQWTNGTADYDVTMNINNLPAEFSGKDIRVQRFLVDQTHSNYTYSTSSAELEKVEDFILSPATSVTKTFYLNKNAMSLLVLTPVHHGEAENLTASVSSGDSQIDVADSDAWGGYFNKFDSDAVNDYVQYTLNVPTSGVYAIYTRVKKGSDRGQFQLSVDGENVGGVKDFYASSFGYDTYYIGNKNFGYTGDRNFRFTATGTSGSGYDLGVDYIQLIPRSTQTYELEDLTPWSTSGDAFWYISDSGASGGKLVKFGSNAAADDIQFNINVTQSGTYSLRVGVKKFDTRGIFQLSVNGTNLGTQQDNYSSTATFEELTIGTITFDTTGNKRIKFYINGKNASSSGYDLGLDYIKLVP